jgi:hypothetical protein
VKIPGADSAKRGTALSLLASFSIFFLFGNFSILSPCICMNSSQMLIQILLTGEPFSSMALAGVVRAVELFSRSTMLIVHLTLVSKETTRVSEAW